MTEDAERSPREIADEARDTALEAIQEAQEESMDPAVLAPAEQRAKDDFADGMAEAIEAGLRPSDLGAYITPIEETIHNYNKSQVKAAIQDAIEDLEASKKTPLQDVIRDRLRKVTKVKTTDRKQGTVYRWDFPDGVVETRSGKDGRGHFSWPNFRDLYLEATEEDTGQPSQNYRGGEEWREFMVDMIEERGHTVEHTGPRTLAVEEVKNHIRNQMGYSDDEEMFARDGVGLAFRWDDEPPVYWLPMWWDWEMDGTPRDVPDFPPVSEIRVPAYVIQRIVERHSISTRALQTELDARGYTLNRLGRGVSDQAYVNGENHTYWALSPDLAVPRVYDPDPRSAAEQIDDEIMEPAGSADAPAAAATDGGGSPGDEGDDKDEDDEPGFESVGGDA